VRVRRAGGAPRRGAAGARGGARAGAACPAASDRARKPPELGGGGLRAAGELLQALPARGAARPRAAVLVDRDAGPDAGLDVGDGALEGLDVGRLVHEPSIPPEGRAKNAASRRLEVRFRGLSGW